MPVTNWVGRHTAQRNKDAMLATSVALFPGVAAGWLTQASPVTTLGMSGGAHVWCHAAVSVCQGKLTFRYP